MNSRLRLILLITTFIGAGFILTCRIFDSELANSTIDWISFFAGTFLVAEGCYKLIKFRGDPFCLQTMRCIRILIGFCIFIIHIIQFICGIDAPVVSAPVNGAIIDWFAFFFGIFLVVEGILRLFITRGQSAGDQALRAIRVLIGSCVFTIHILQFMRF